MPKTLLYVFETFCDDLPEKVRDDLQFMMVMLSDEDLTVDEVGNIDKRVPELDPFLLRRQRCFAVILARRKVLAVRRCIDGGQRCGNRFGAQSSIDVGFFYSVETRDAGLTSIDLPPGLTPKAIYTLTIPQNAANPNGAEPVCFISSRLKRIGSDEGAWPYVDAPAVGGPR